MDYSSIVDVSDRIAVLTAAWTDTIQPLYYVYLLLGEQIKKRQSTSEHSRYLPTQWRHLPGCLTFRLYRADDIPAPGATELFLPAATLGDKPITGERERR